jgi:hypothetical protein
MLISTFIVEVPAKLLIEDFDMRLELNCSLLHNSMNLLCLFKPLNSSVLQLWLNTLLSQIDTHFLLVNTQNFHHLLFANLQELVDRLHTFVGYLR